MSKKVWMVIGSILGIAAFAAAVYLTMILTGNQTGVAFVRENYEMVLPTQWPTRPSDLESLVAEVKDNSIFVTPVLKRKDAQQEYPQVEVVVANHTKIYRDETNRQHPTIVEGKFHWVLNPFALDQIKPGYVLNAWGDRRGDRLIAETIIIYIIPTENNTKQ